MKTARNPKLKEDSRHAQGYFPANTYTMVVKDMDQILPTHWHDEWEFFFVVSGQCVFQLNDSSIPMAEGDMAFVPAGQVHAAFAVDRDPCSYNALVFHTNLLTAPEYDVAFRKYIAPMLDGTGAPAKLSPGIPWQAEVIGCVHRAYGLLQSRPAAYELKLKACIFSAFADICANCPQTSGQHPASSDSPDYRAERMRGIYDYIHANCAARLTVQTLSRVVCMSPGYLCRFFKEMTGRTITEYINHYRVSQAALMIEATDKKLLEVALDAGFNNLSYFVNQFKRYMGATPSEFRKTRQKYYSDREKAAGS